MKFLSLNAKRVTDTPICPKVMITHQKPVVVTAKVDGNLDLDSGKIP